MEHAKIELEVLEQATKAATEEQIRDLIDLQLVFVGGGIAELVGC